MNDDFLNQFRKAPRREFADALYKRINQPMNAPSRFPTIRVMAGAIAVFAVIAGILFLSPSTRAFADAIFRQFGGYVFVQNTPQPNPAKEAGKDGKVVSGPQSTISPEQLATLQAVKQQAAEQAGQDQNTNKQNAIANGSVKPANDAIAAGQLAGFTVLAPAYLPAGYVPNDQPGAWTVSHESDGVMASIVYANPADHGRLVINEQKYQQGGPSTVIDRPEVQDLTVRGQPGAWMPDNGGKSVLAWEENGITYMVVCTSLSRDEALKVAESLGK